MSVYRPDPEDYEPMHGPDGRPLPDLDWTGRRYAELARRARESAGKSVDKSDRHSLD